MSTPDTWYAYFNIRGAFDPVEITCLTRISPSYSIKEGEIGRHGNAVPCSHWELKSRMGLTDPLESHVTDVLQQLDQNEGTFKSLAKEYGGTMQLVGYFKDVEPRMHFAQETLEKIAKYGLSLDCDFYNWR